MNQLLGRGLHGLAVSLLLILTGCQWGTLQHDSAPSYIVSRWQGFAYVTPRTPVVLNVLMVGAMPRWTRARLSGSAELESFTESPLRTPPGGYLEIQWLPRLYAPSESLPLRLVLEDGRHTTAVNLGTWDFRTIPSSVVGPLAIRSQSIGFAGYTLPRSYALAMRLAVPRLSLLRWRDMSLVLDVRPDVVQARVAAPHLVGGQVAWSGTLIVHSRTTLLYLVPAIRYRYGDHTYERPLLPIQLTVVAARSSARAYGVLLP